MNSLSVLASLDQQLFELFSDPSSLDADHLEGLLEQRAVLIQTLISESNISEEHASQVVERSRMLKKQAEETRKILAEKLASTQKGRRSAKAYQQVKHNQES